MTKPSYKTEITLAELPETDNQQDLAAACKRVLTAIPPVSLDPSADPSAKEAARWLHEAIINYFGMLRKRPLTKSVEFLIPAGKLEGYGWYYKVPTVPEQQALVAAGQAALKKFHQPAFNWRGPYPSRKLAEAARDENLPRTKAALEEVKAFQREDDLMAELTALEE